MIKRSLLLRCCSTPPLALSISSSRSSEPSRSPPPGLSRIGVFEPRSRPLLTACREPIDSVHFPYLAWYLCILRTRPWNVGKRRHHHHAVKHSQGIGFASISKGFLLPYLYTFAKLHQPYRRLSIERHRRIAGDHSRTTLHQSRTCTVYRFRAAHEILTTRQ